MDLRTKTSRMIYLGVIVLTMLAAICLTGEAATSILKAISSF